MLLGLRVKELIRDAILQSFEFSVYRSSVEAFPIVGPVIFLGTLGDLCLWKYPSLQSPVRP